jgi:hypothetical protein
LALGLSRYFTGTPCVHGHLAEKITRSGTCIECHRLRRRRWQDLNPDRVNECRRKNRKRPEVRRAERGQEIRWRTANPDAVRRHKRAEYEKHRDRYVADTNRRRALKCFPAWADRKAIRAIYAEARQLTIKTGVKHVVDHFYPLKSPIMCGLHVEQNLRVITAAANGSKGNRIEGALEWGVSEF